MIPKITQIDTEQVSREVKPVEAREGEAAPPDVDRLRPEVRKAFEESWARNEAAYRYLGR